MARLVSLEEKASAANIISAERSFQRPAGKENASCAILEAKVTHGQECRCHGFTEGARAQNQSSASSLTSHRPLESSLHSLACGSSCHSCLPRQSYRDEIITIFKKMKLKQQKCLASCCQESCHHGKEKKKVPKLALNLFQELSIFFKAPREQMLS